MAATKNCTARCIDDYENLTDFEVRVLLEWFLNHWDSASRTTFSNQFPLLYEKLNPGTLKHMEVAETLQKLLDGDGFVIQK